MKVTKLPQSGLLLEKDGQRIVFDPVRFLGFDLEVESLNSPQAVIYTHSHPDHLNIKIATALQENGSLLYGNDDVIEKADGIAIEPFSTGDVKNLAGFELKSYYLEHCLMVDGSKATVPNNGYIIDGKLLIPGDSTESTGQELEVVAVPIFGPDVSFHDAYRLAMNHKAKKVIPIHNDIVGLHPEAFARFCAYFKVPFEVIPIHIGESTEI